MFLSLIKKNIIIKEVLFFKGPFFFFLNLSKRFYFLKRL
jgi:hypothetical protein